jgi:hypothetical protein
MAFVIAAQFLCRAGNIRAVPSRVELWFGITDAG